MLCLLLLYRCGFVVCCLHRCERIVFNLNSRHLTNSFSHHRLLPRAANQPIINHVLQSRNRQSHLGAQGPYRLLVHRHQKAYAGQPARRQEVDERRFSQSSQGRS